MNFRNKNPETLDVNITPLIDVVFLLLIFFMVTTTFQKDAELAIALPEASSEQQQPPEALELVIDRQGRYYLDGKELTNAQVSTLQNALNIASSGKKDRPLIIRADANVHYQAVITVMDIASKLGIVNLSLATSNSAHD